MDLFEVLSPWLPEVPDVVVEPRIGSGPYGDVHGPPATHPAIVEAQRRFVRDSSGTEVVSETTLYCRITVDCPAGSKVTLPDGHITTVIAATPHSGHGNADLPEHLEINCK